MVLLIELDCNFMFQELIGVIFFLDGIVLGWRRRLCRLYLSWSDTLGSYSPLFHYSDRLLLGMVLHLGRDRTPPVTPRARTRSSR
jgi:hypothetical protein